MPQCRPLSDLCSLRRTSVTALLDQPNRHPVVPFLHFARSVRPPTAARSIPKANPSLLIPLNICRHKENYLTWKCDDERHAYDKCQYDE